MFLQCDFDISRGMEKKFYNFIINSKLTPCFTTFIAQLIFLLTFVVLYLCIEFSLIIVIIELNYLLLLYTNFYFTNILIISKR